MTRGLRSLTAVANTIQAREDWKALAQEALAAGVDWEPFAFRTYSGWRVIDRHIALLRAAIVKAKGEEQ